MKNTTLVALVSILIVLLLISGCGKAAKQTSTTSIAGSATIQGTVKDSVSDQPLSGVSIDLNGKSATTDSAGKFTIGGISAGNKVIEYSKEGYISYQKNLVLGGASSNIGTVYMVKVGTTSTLDASAGGTVSDKKKKASVSLPADGLVDESGAKYEGKVNVKLTAFDPSNQADLKSFPGDFSGITAGGEKKQIETFGFINVQLEAADGSSLNLADGKTSQIEIPVPESSIANAPETIPLWFFDSDSSTWKEEGTATLEGDVYRGTVTHFSYWNADMVDDTSYIKGRFMDAAFSDKPVPGVYVSAFGIDYGGMDATQSDAEGKYLLKVKANSVVDVFFSTMTLSDYVKRNVQTLPPGETLDLGDFPVYADTTIAAFMKTDLSSKVGPNAMYPNIATSGGKTVLVCQGTSGAEFVQGDGSWGKAEIITSNISLNPAVQATSSGEPRVVFVDIGGLEYAEKSGGGWKITNIDGDQNIPFHSFVLDKNGVPHVVYYSATEGKLYYAASNGASWTKTDVSAVNDDASSDSCIVRSISLAASSGGKLGLAYACTSETMYEDYYLKYAGFDGSWKVDTIKHMSGVGFDSWTPSLVFSGDEPLVAAAVLTDSLRLYRRSGGSWTDKEIEPAMPVSAIGTAAFMWPSLAVDSRGEPAVAYAAYSTGTASHVIKFASYDGSTWKKTTVDSYPSPLFPMMPIVLKLTADDKARIVYVMQDLSGNMMVKIAEMQ
jgi:hypothetical protein